MSLLPPEWATPVLAVTCHILPVLKVTSQAPSVALVPAGLVLPKVALVNNLLANLVKLLVALINNPVVPLPKEANLVPTVNKVALNPKEANPVNPRPTVLLKDKTLDNVASNLAVALLPRVLPKALPLPPPSLNCSAFNKSKLSLPPNNAC